MLTKEKIKSHLKNELPQLRALFGFLNDAVIRNLEIISEATKKIISPNIKGKMKIIFSRRSTPNK